MALTRAHIAQTGNWNACYFTDGVYSNGSNLGDSGRGLNLLYWDGYGTGKTCHITIWD